MVSPLIVLACCIIYQHLLFMWLTKCNVSGHKRYAPLCLTIPTGIHHAVILLTAVCFDADVASMVLGDGPMVYNYLKTHTKMTLLLRALQTDMVENLKMISPGSTTNTS